MKEHNILQVGVHFLIFAFILFLADTVGFISGLVSVNIFRFLTQTNLTFNFFISGVLFVAADFLLAAVFIPKKQKSLMVSPITSPQISIGMTAYNDELSIGGAVRDFIAQGNVVRLTVVDNNSSDKTTEEALKAGAAVVRESVQGYGACCIRALKEAMKFGNIVCLVEGDETFSGRDIGKFVAYMSPL